MCGFVAMVGCGSAKQLETAVRSIQHRGPDGEGLRWFERHGSGIGHRRLSIIDLSEAASQPLTVDEQRYWIVYNGELYNYQQVRKDLDAVGVRCRTASDTEVILRAYLHWGPACLDRFNGMFAFVIYDSVANAWFGARDRLGIKPFYILEDGRRIILASEIKAILASGEVRAEADWAAIHTPVHFQAGPWTGFKGIRKLAAGATIRIVDGVIDESRYWKLEPTERSATDDDVTTQIRGLLGDAVDLQMVADVPVGVLLSGGLDSSLIAALMRQRASGPVSSFTIRFAEDDLRRQGNVDDASFARRLAGELELDHHEILIRPDVVDLLPKMVYHLDEPIADPAAINTFLIAQAAREQGIVVLLSGMGGDEVFGGYRAQRACLVADTYKRWIPASGQWALRALLSRLPESSQSRNFKLVRWAKRFSEFASMPRFERYLAASNSALTAETFNQYFREAGPYEGSHYVQLQRELFHAGDVSYLGRICACDSQVYMVDHNLTYSDKASMAAGVECRPPLIDHRLVELMFSLPPQFRIRGKSQKHILKEAVRPMLPEYILNRPKAPFSAPMRGWLRNELREMVEDLLSERSVAARGVFEPAYVRRIVDENLSGRRDYSQLVFRLMVNEVWFRTFIDRPVVSTAA